ncbi:MAG TPA: YbhB/YbcL family Raf kinase inhibitor-like protein [Rhodocyclaceae bacterium]|nr:YbhB/YbcL family Raf kinase inhibitor-like protein [Rhodocyclaceae bacterium]
MCKLLGALMLCIAASGAYAFDLVSSDIKAGAKMPAAQEFNSFGCKGDNLSPSLAWQNPPVGTQSFAITMFDPDAPTGSGWWHWIVYDIPASANSLPSGIITKNPLPDGAKQGRNDFGGRGYGGACPPVGDKPHHYRFTVFALKVPKLDVPEDASGALIGFMLNTNSLGTASFVTLYGR